MKDQKIAVGDMIEFGRYPLTRDGKWGPIEWKVLDKSNSGELTLISRYGLDVKPFHEEFPDVTWETCSLREWLNATFLNTAFTELEKKQIVPTTVPAENRIKHVPVLGKSSGTKKNVIEIDGELKFDTTAGKTTKDSVYLLSIKDAIKYFDMDRHNGWYYSEKAVCEPTDYALSRDKAEFFEVENASWYGINAYQYSPGFVGRKLCWWWLRSPGSVQCDAAGIYSDGSIAYGGREVDDSKQGYVRPVVTIRAN